MRISDWSSDVCSSDLEHAHRVGAVAVAVAQVEARVEHQRARDRPVLGELVVELVELHGRAGQGGFQRDALQGAAGRLQEVVAGVARPGQLRSEEHTSELQSLMRISYAVFCCKKKYT